MATTSSTESEVVAFAEVCKVLVYYMNLLDSMHIPLVLPTLVFSDSLPGINSLNHAPGLRNRHYHSRTLFIRSLVDNGTLEFKHVATGENPADLGTKSLTSALHQRHTNYSLTSRSQLL